jgi:hypothetical protein
MLGQRNFEVKGKPSEQWAGSVDVHNGSGSRRLVYSGSGSYLDIYRKENVLFQLKIRGASEKFKNQPGALLRPKSINFRQHFRNLYRKTVLLRTGKTICIITFYFVSVTVQIVEGGDQTLQPIAEVPENGSDSGSYQSQVNRPSLSGIRIRRNFSSCTGSGSRSRSKMFKNVLFSNCLPIVTHDKLIRTLW